MKQSVYALTEPLSTVLINQYGEMPIAYATTRDGERLAIYENCDLVKSTSEEIVMLYHLLCVDDYKPSNAEVCYEYIRNRAISSAEIFGLNACF